MSIFIGRLNKKSSLGEMIGVFIQAQKKGRSIGRRGDEERHDWTEEQGVEGNGPPSGGL